MANFNRIEVHAVDHCTLSCIGCNHGSPHLRKKSYMVEDYTVWFDLLINKGHRWRSIGISGGEPFLLLNKINEFCQTLKQKYKCPIHIFTNGFWLNSERCVDDYSVCFSNIDSLQISFYKPYVEKIGIEKMKSTLDLIKNKYNIKIYSFQNEGVKKFGQVYFYDIPVKIN